jgi:hypothetical protein
MGWGDDRWGEARWGVDSAVTSTALSTLTLEGMIQRVRDAVNDSSSVFYSDAMITRWLNIGQRDVAAKTFCLEYMYGMISAASVRHVALTGIDLLRIHAVEYVPDSGRRIGLGKIVPSMLGRMCLDGITPQYWFPWGNYVCIEPVPSVSTYKMIAYISVLPSAEMSNNSDITEIYPTYSQWVVDYAIIRALWRARKFGEAAVRYSVYTQALTQVRQDYLRKYINKEGELEIPHAIEAIKQ